MRRGSRPARRGRARAAGAGARPRPPRSLLARILRPTRLGSDAWRRRLKPRRAANYKIVFTGPVGAGKTTAIAALSDVPPVTTDEHATDMTQERKPTTTVAMDYGLMKLADDQRIHLYGTPGQERFDFMWEILVEGGIGLVLLLDGSRPAPHKDMLFFLDAFRDFIASTSVVIGVTRTDLAPDLSLDVLHDHLRQDRPQPAGLQRRRARPGRRAHAGQGTALCASIRDSQTMPHFELPPRHGMLAPTPGGVYHATLAPDDESDRRAGCCCALMTGDDHAGAVRLDAIRAWSGLGRDRGRRRGLPSAAVARAGAARRAAAPRAEATLEELLPTLLAQLSRRGKALLADAQGFYLATAASRTRPAEELSALSADLGLLHERHQRMLRHNLGIDRSSWALIDAAGNSQLGVWPLFIGSQRFALVLPRAPRS